MIEYYRDEITLKLGDARELIDTVPDGSVDLIFTDPPYIKRYIHLYKWLGLEGPRVLKPDGFLMAYAGIYWKEIVMNYLGVRLEYFWDFVLENGGNSPIMWKRKIISRYKSILAYIKPNSKALPRTNVLSLWRGGGKDKRYHVWGQDESSARYFIDCFSREGDTILDPFTGGGTVPAICKKLKRKCIAFEKDEETYISARERIEQTQEFISHEQYEMELR